MARRCSLTGKGVQAGNNVSHANNKTRRRFLPNIQNHRLYSETLGRSVRLRIATNTLRTIEKRGGLDGFLLSSSEAALTAELVRVRRQLETAQLAARSAG